METIIYIIILSLIFLIVGRWIDKNLEKALGYFLYSLIGFGLIGCTGALIFSHGKPIIWYLVIPLVLIYAGELIILLCPRSPKDDREKFQSVK